jgi:hypothetical protein
LAEELKDRSTAPDIVPAARYGASGAIATSADRCALLMHAMRGEGRERGEKKGYGSLGNGCSDLWAMALRIGGEMKITEPYRQGVVKIRKRQRCNRAESNRVRSHFYINI